LAAIESRPPMADNTVRVGSIVIDCRDFARMMAFWREALGYVPVRPPTPGDPFVILKDPAGKGPNVSIDQMPPERGILHLDLYTDDQAGEIERLLQLGATRYRPREPGEDFVVLEDPEGNLFCVVDTKSP
jgi:catechol 2,3-dioxygenase-like lactoylglutathione lyase family enzyme